MRRLTGGASRETWSFDAVCGDGGERALVVRLDSPKAGGRRGMALEAQAIRAAAAAGVPEPAVVLSDEDPSDLGAAYMIMERVEGETIPRRILRAPELASARRVLARQCGEVLARVHQIPPAALEGLEAPDPLGSVAEGLRLLDEPRPVLELGLRWLLASRPAQHRRQTVVHGDFRNGNLVVGPEGIRAVLDWELVHLGDPARDLGWLCVKAWRFGSPEPVGGFGSYDELLAGYSAGGGAPVSLEEVRWWEAYGTLWWGLGCLQQARRHLGGSVRSVELAAIGRRACEQEWDLLGFLAGGPPGQDDQVRPPAPRGPTEAGEWGGLHGRPTAAELLEAVREFLAEEALPATEGRLQFLIRVSARALEVVSRELRLGPGQARQHAERLAALGYSSDWELVEAIRAGLLDGRIVETAAVLEGDVAAKLEVADPRYLEH